MPVNLGTRDDHAWHCGRGIGFFIRNDPQAQSRPLCTWRNEPQPWAGFARFHLQKLYGVVLLTETAQARLGKRLDHNSERIWTKIGESARQTP